MTPSTLPTTAEALHQKLTARTAHVGIVGLGYVGLPLAVEFGKHFPTVGFEIVDRADVPASVLASEQFTHACPSTAIVMRRVLTSAM